MAGRNYFPAYLFMPKTEKATVMIDKPRKLCFNVWAMEKISEKYGSVDSAYAQTDLQKDYRKGIDSICGMIEILITAEILRKNAAIRLGLETGEPENDFVLPREDMKLLWKAGDFKKCKAKIVEAMNDGYETDYESEEQDEEKDLVLEEIENEKNVQKAGA